MVPCEVAKMHITCKLKRKMSMIHSAGTKNAEKSRK